MFPSPIPVSSHAISLSETVIDIGMYLVVSEDIKLLLKQQPVKWSSFFNYLGSPIAGIEGLSFLVDSVVAQVVKICCALGSACRSAVALPLSRIVDLNQSLVTPVALLNCVAWFHF